MKLIITQSYQNSAFSGHKAFSYRNLYFNYFQAEEMTFVTEYNNQFRIYICKETPYTLETNSELDHVWIQKHIKAMIIRM